MPVKIKALLFFIATCFIIFSVGMGAGYLIAKTRYAREQAAYTEYRAATERELGQLRGALADAQVRSDTAIRGLDDALRGLGAIQDRNKRITYLIDAVGATVKQLRAIYDRTSQAISEYGTEPQPMEDHSNK